MESKAKPLVWVCGIWGRSPQKLTTLFVKICYFVTVLGMTQRYLHSVPMQVFNTKRKKDQFGGTKSGRAIIGRPAQYVRPPCSIGNWRSHASGGLGEAPSGECAGRPRHGNMVDLKVSERKWAVERSRGVSGDGKRSGRVLIVRPWFNWVGHLHSGVEVCMGMGIPIPMGFVWDSHGNGSSFGLLMRIGMGMGIVLIGMGIAYFIDEK